MPGSILILTGPKNTGKSAFCRELARAAARAGVDVAGVCTEKRRRRRPHHPGEGLEPGLHPRVEREQLVVTDLRSGHQAPLGFREGDRWTLLQEGFALGREALAAATPCHLLVVDEIGRLELRHGSGWTGVFGIVATGAYRQAVVTVRQGCLDAFRRALAAAAPEGRPARLRVHELHGDDPPGERDRLQQELLAELTRVPREAVELR
ncbi:P-loop NTPase family protein [Limnochorda pilosa]|uniref:AAA+ ATPase domain-containing protein n=1 Tax=Limnochorda pilosa TaxID=1555112 RepID=A0A0K2SGM3_LIMPI|nr:hypothetical protein [Limnochorda pilosa]BAS26240.1 hypothetical protein LIP_0383 [Limnochorda pilosa]